MSKILEKILSKDIFVISFIFICLMIAFAPSYQFDYFRHDDWASACWDRIAINTHHLFGNAVLNEFRPYTMIFIYYSELFTEYLSGAKIVKIATIGIFSLSSFLLYKWLKIFNINSFYAIFLSIVLFVLPPMQVMSSTYQYFFMAAPILLCAITFSILWDIQNKNYNNINYVYGFILFIQLITFATFYPVFIIYTIIISSLMYFLHRKYKKNSSDQNAKIFMYVSAFIMYFTAITAYPPSAMYIWFLLSVPLLMYFKSEKKELISNFAIKVFIFSASTMIIYFLLGKFFAYILGIDTNHARGMSISGDFGKIFFHTIDAFRITSNLWDIKQYFKTGLFWDNYDMLIIIFSLFLISLFAVYKKNNNYKIGFIIFISISSLVFFTIAPLVLSNNGATMYRYLIALSPLAGFIFLWSISIVYSLFPKIIYENYIIGLILLSFFIGSIFMSNQTIFKNLVEPNQYEMNYLSNFLDKEIIPKIKNKEKVVIHHIQGKVNYTKNRYSLDEYNVSMTVFKWPVLPSIVMLLKDKGIYTQSRTCFPSKWEPDHGVFNLNWGSIELFTNIDSYKKNASKEADILIDMGKLDFID